MGGTTKPEQRLSRVTGRDLQTVGLFSVAQWVLGQGRRLCAADETHQFLVSLDHGVSRSGIKLAVVQGKNPFEEWMPVFVEIPGVGFHAVRDNNAYRGARNFMSVRYWPQ